MRQVGKKEPRTVRSCESTLSVDTGPTMMKKKVSEDVLLLLSSDVRRAPDDRDVTMGEEKPPSHPLSKKGRKRERFEASLVQAEFLREKSFRGGKRGVRIGAPPAQNP